MRAWVNAAVMPLSLKLPEGFMPSYCRNSRPGVHADILARPRRPAEDRLPLADGQDLLVAGEREQLAEPPDAAELERVGPPGPLAPRSRSGCAAAGGGPSRRRRPSGRRTLGTETTCRPGDGRRRRRDGCSAERRRRSCGHCSGTLRPRHAAVQYIHPAARRKCVRGAESVGPVRRKCRLCGRSST